MVYTFGLDYENRSQAFRMAIGSFLSKYLLVSASPVIP